MGTVDRSSSQQRALGNLAFLGMCHHQQPASQTLFRYKALPFIMSKSWILALMSIGALASCDDEDWYDYLSSSDKS